MIVFIQFMQFPELSHNQAINTLIFLSILSVNIIRMIRRSNTNYAKNIVEERKKGQDRNLLYNYINTNLNTLSSGKIQEMKNDIHLIIARDTVPRSLKKKVSILLSKLNDNFEKAEYKENLEELRTSKETLETDIRYLEEQKKELAQTKEDKNNEIKNDLDIRNNRVYLKDNLTTEEIAVLNDEGYIQCNEYCVEQQKTLTVLVKPTLNHSKTHTFLVWSVKNLLENKFKVVHLREHDTKDADITFIHNKKDYALEIETGTWLKKKKQFQDKVKQLNRKYKNCWMFIVSNKNLVVQYNKYGVTTQRKSVEKKLQKLLQN